MIDADVGIEPNLDLGNLRFLQMRERFFVKAFDYA
jgi:hypothetical protein